VLIRPTDQSADHCWLNIWLCVNLQNDDDEEATGEVLISIQPVHQGCVTSLKQTIAQPSLEVAPTDHSAPHSSLVNEHFLLYMSYRGR